MIRTSHKGCINLPQYHLSFSNITRILRQGLCERDGQQERVPDKDKGNLQNENAKS